jgi:hypothetical protein
LSAGIWVKLRDAARRRDAPVLSAKTCHSCGTRAIFAILKSTKHALDLQLT